MSDQLDYLFKQMAQRDAFGNQKWVSDPRSSSGGYVGTANVSDLSSYGGSRAAAEQEASRLGNEGKNWDNAFAGDAGPIIDYSAADAARGQAQQARGEQEYGQSAAALMEQGGGPSAATAQYAMSSDAAMQAQASQGGLGAQRAGVQQANGNLGALGGARSAETGAGRQAYIGGAGDMRSGDLGQARMDWGQQQALAKDFYQKRGLTDEMSQFYNEQEYGARAAQLNSQVNAREINRTRQIQHQQAEADRDTVGRDMTNALGATIGAIGGAVGGFVTGGPVGAVAGGAAGFGGGIAASAARRRG